MADSERNPLVVQEKATSGQLQVSLHPLALLSVSDYITRHRLRQQPGPIFGLLLGQHAGRELTIEVAFEAQARETAEPDGTKSYMLDEGKLELRLEQMKEVYNKPQLDLVGWYTPVPTSGPQQEHLAVHRQVLAKNESAVLLAFHAAQVLDKSTAGGKLPITVYETIVDSEALAGQAAATDSSAGKAPVHEEDGSLYAFKFRELPYTIESVDAEMVAVTHVAKAVGSAAVPKAKPSGDGGSSKEAGKKGAKSDVKADAEAASNPLTPEEEEMLAFLSAKLNAVKMLRSRITLMSTYLRSLPPSFTQGDGSESLQDASNINFHLLREIKALTNRIPLLLPSESDMFTTEQLSEKNDVSLLALLGVMTKSVKDARELNRKYGIVLQSLNKANRTGGAGSGKSIRPGQMSEDYPFSHGEFDDTVGGSARAQYLQSRYAQQMHMSRGDSGFGDRDMDEDMMEGAD